MTAAAKTVVHCRSCQAEVIRCVSIVGKRMPIDAWPIVGGNIRITDGDPPHAYVQPSIDLFDDDDTGARFVSHFATCPEAGEWRKR